jgi:elongation factor Tu
MPAGTSPTLPSAQAKPHVKVGTLGHLDHGKTTLAAAILARQGHKNRVAAVKTYEEITRAGPERDPLQTVTLAVAHVEYETPERHYGHIDCPGHSHHVRNLISGAAPMDGAILVVGADDGPTPQTRQQVLLASRVGVPHLAVFLNKCDRVWDRGMVERAEQEVRTLLTECALPGDQIPVVRGSALVALQSRGTDDNACACLDVLLDTLDRFIPVREEERPFLMGVEDVYVVEGRGTAAAGRIERGVVRVGDEVEIVGRSRAPTRAVVAGVEMFQRALQKGIAGDRLGVLLRGIEHTELERGHVLAGPGSVGPHTRFEACVYVLIPEECGRIMILLPGTGLQFGFRTTEVTGTVTLPQGARLCMPGDHLVGVTVELAPDTPVVLDAGCRFTIRERGTTVGAGVVTRVLA